jgi:hypothetical protein
MKRTKQAQKAVAKATAYRKGEAATPKRGSDVKGRNRNGEQRDQKDQEAEARKKALVAVGKQKAKEMNAAKTATQPRQMPNRGPEKRGQGPERSPAPRRPMLTSGDSQPKTSRPAPAAAPAQVPEYDPTR